MLLRTSNWQTISIGSGNGLVPNRCQAVTWTNDDQSTDIYTHPWQGFQWYQRSLPEASFGLRVLSLPASVCVCLSVCQSLACPRDNSGPVQARIAKFGPKMQKTLVKVPIVLWTDRPWPSRSNLTWKSKFTPFWACPHHNSPPIQARITKFGPEVQNTLVKIPVALGGNWPWPSRSNMT